jgi:uncharacterized protein YkwD
LRVLARGLPTLFAGHACIRRSHLAALVVGFVVLTAAHHVGQAEGSGVHASSCPGARTSPAHSRQFMRAMLCLQDAERRRHGLGGLRVHRALRRAAAAHARDMVRHRYFGHVSPGGTNPLGRALGSGYRSGRKIRIRENILTWSAPLTAAEVMRKWMASAPHRHNILRRGWRDVGAALVKSCTSGSRGLTVVVEFGRKYR